MTEKITTVIFDLGGVLFDIDYSLTQNAFKELGADDFHNRYSQQVQHGIFDKFEKGHITPEQFRSELRKYLHGGATFEQVDAAWNALLIGFSGEKVELVKRLKSRYRLFLLSNTNEIHLPAVLHRMNSMYGEGIMAEMFEKEYYSCKMGMRKPDTEIFEYVINENNLVPSSTLFIDDSIQNIEGAAKTGLQTLHCTPSVKLSEYFFSG